MLQHLNQSPSLTERTVVVGSGGFVGGALMRRLQAAGAPALGLTRKEIDLTGRGAAERLSDLLRSTDAVVAVAARAPCKDMGMMVENMLITRAITDALAKTPVEHVVNIGSDAVYADGPVPLTESTPTAPTSLHGAMHLAREIAFTSLIKSPLALLRPTLIYGAQDPHNGYGPNRFRRLANAGQEIVLFGEGEERRDHVLVDDVSEIILRVLQWRSTGVLNVASGETHSFREVAELVMARAGRTVSIKSSPRSGPMPHNGYRPFDISACRAAFADFTYTALPEGIAKAQREPARA
ncbi:MAG: SDR family oxidoreductase [Xanthobacteraceae bacterium]